MEIPIPATIGGISILGMIGFVANFIYRESDKRGKIYKHIEEKYMPRTECSLVNEQNEKDHKHMNDKLDDIGNDVKTLIKNGSK